jgi:hypothetical protein
MMVVDPKWSDHISSLAARSGAQVLPLFFEGRNSLLFQSAGAINPLCRTALIGRELARMRGKTVKVRVGKPIAPGKLESFDSHSEITQFLRLKTYILKDREVPKSDKEGVIKRFPLVFRKKVEDLLPVVDPVDQSILIKEVESLGKESLLVSHGAFQVFLAKAKAIPGTLREIGRLREVTFREIGEGLGCRSTSTSMMNTTCTFSFGIMRLAKWLDPTGWV